MRERRIIPSCELEVREDGDGVHLVGYGAVFYDGTDGTQYELWADMFERVDAHAFDASVNGDDIRGLFNHDPNVVLGRTTAATMSLATDAKGLRYDILLPDSGVGKDVAVSVRRGDVSGSSFSFAPRPSGVRYEYLENVTIRTLLDVRLYDVGPVTFPAYEATTVEARNVDIIRADLRREAAKREAVARRLRLMELSVLRRA